MMGLTPWYVYVLQYGGAIVSLLYPIFLVVILFLAYKEFKRLVDHIAPKPTGVVMLPEVKKEEAKKEKEEVKKVKKEA
ncbi:hypothetical protein [Candidatus Oleimmundimicrobium sp.]|uniref:hypothetical protein n=1 Tax=Candidatus Oleimmundimicrobium sp. TaxID=3060597 RepID=UPI00271B18A6|nr:hypothetical protein [Candidatus Oleimmundimicrobium sp.]MDO8886466.1 hypothetical protein [Candidatus Oleimmundimicrobium sp.]